MFQREAHPDAAAEGSPNGEAAPDIKICLKASGNSKVKEGVSARLMATTSPSLFFTVDNDQAFA